mmetsp:Transcript_84247/g.212427  ORF Transcript_84247/g.212427 Transcript_84247/m.212427 type:complete len:171 (+) Transcript_84247:95-607(+)
MSKMQLASIFFAVLALAAAAMPVEDSADIQAALSEDDTCAASGEEGAICALNALQLQASKLATEGGEEGGNAEEESDACHAGLVGQINAFAPSCFSQCPQMCGPLGQAITAFMQRGGAAAAKPVICSHQAQFGCALHGSAYGACSPLIQKAAKFGFTLPTSSGALQSQCR